MGAAAVGLTAGAGAEGGGKPARLFLLNGFFYYLNNQMNFLVLEKVDVVTHGLINCGRRVANIMFAIVWFGTAVTLYNGVGIWKHGALA